MYIQAWVRIVGSMLECKEAVAVEFWGGGRIKIRSEEEQESGDLYSLGEIRVRVRSSGGGKEIIWFSEIFHPGPFHK